MFEISPTVKILFITKLHAILTQEVKFELRKTTKKAIFKGLNYTVQDRRRETGDWSQKTGDRRQTNGRQVGDRRQTCGRQVEDRIWEIDRRETGGIQDMGDRQARDRL